MLPKPKSQRYFLFAAGVALVGATAIIVWKWPSAQPPAEATSAAPVLVASAIDLEAPPESFATLQHVLQNGGCPVTWPAAIAWLDTHSSQQLPPTREHTAYLFAMIDSGGHPAWDVGYRQHLFNSAFNAIHLAHVEVEFTPRLLQLALHDADRVMRLYALQHLNSQRRVGHLPDGPLAAEVHQALQLLALDRQGELSGYAIQVLASWDGAQDGPNDPAVRALALATAADPTRPIDVRVSAIHAAGAASLPLARRLATDATQPVMLRKSAIARIGRHGDENDLSTLETLRTESNRLAQAADPALHNIRTRLANPSNPTLIPL